MAKIEVRGDSDAGSLYVNGRFIRSFWYKDRADADIIAEKLTQALALPDPSVATAQNSHLPEAKPVDREFLNKYLQTLSGMLATTGVVGPVGENALTVEIRAVLDELRKAIGLPTRPLLVPGYVVPASALVSPPAVDIKIVTIRPKGWYRITLNGVKVGIFGALDLAQKRVDELRQALGLPLEFPVKGAVTVAPATIKPDVGISQNGEDMLVNGFAVVAPEERATRAKEEIMISFSEWQRQFLGSATYQEQRELYQNYVNRVLDKMEGFPLYSRFGLEPQNIQFKSEVPTIGLRVRVKEGPFSGGKQGRTLGPNVQVATRWWTPVKWDDGEDEPSWVLTAGLEYKTEYWSDFEKK